MGKIPIFYIPNRQIPRGIINQEINEITTIMMGRIAQFTIYNLKLTIINTISPACFLVPGIYLLPEQ